MAKLKWNDLTVETHRQTDDDDPTHWEGVAAYNGNTCRFSYNIPVDPVIADEDSDDVSHDVKSYAEPGEIPEGVKESILAFFNR